MTIIKLVLIQKLVFDFEIILTLNEFDFEIILTLNELVQNQTMK